MLQREPSKRATITAVKDHKWLKDIRTKLQTDPTSELPQPTPPLEGFDEFCPPPPSNTIIKQLSSDITADRRKIIRDIKRFFGVDNISYDAAKNLIIDVNGQKQTVLQANLTENSDRRSHKLTMFLIAGNEIKFSELFSNLISEINFQ